MELLPDGTVYPLHVDVYTYRSAARLSFRKWYRVIDRYPIHTHLLSYLIVAFYFPEYVQLHYDYRFLRG